MSLDLPLTITYNNNIKHTKGDEPVVTTLTPAPIKSSSNIAGAQYDLLTRKLTIEFVSGGVYEYTDVPAYVAFGFTVAESLGKFFHAAIRNQFTFTRIS